MTRVDIKLEMEDPKTEFSDFGTCRFCEAQGEHSNMTSEAMGGNRESYLDILLECFNVFLSTDVKTSSLICRVCAARLRDARDFKQLVLRAQGVLHQAAEVAVEASVSQMGMDVDITQEPVEPEGSKELKPEEPGPVLVKMEPKEPELVLTKLEPEEPGPVLVNLEPEEPAPVLVKMEPEEPGPVLVNLEPEEPAPVLVKMEPEEPGPVLVNLDSEEPGQVLVKMEPEEPGPVLVNLDSEEPGQVLVKMEPVEPELDIVEHELTRKPEARGQTLKILTNKLDAVEESYTDQNVYYAHPESVQKFLEVYYNSQGDEEEESNSVLVMLEDKNITDMDEETLFLNTGCGCRLACLDKFDRNDVLKSRLDCLEQDYYCFHHINHLELMMLGALSATVNIIPKAAYGGKPKQKAHVAFLYRGFSVCKKFFLFVYGIGNSKKYEKVLKCFRETGVEALTNGNKKSLMTKQQRSDVVTFISNFSEQNSLVLPGRSPDNTDLHILPSSMTRTSIYEQYVRAYKQGNKYPVSRTLWYRTWDNFCPNVTVKLSTDPCITCQEFIIELSRRQPDDIKKKKCLKNALDHLNHVQVERAYYQSIVTQVTPLLMMAGATLGHHAPCSYDGLVHYSFDYIQHIHLPHYHDMLGPLNFLNGYKVSLFGVAIEPLQKFVIYIIPEYIPKGTNLVVSLLHHFFDTYALGETHVVCHTVANQNKNNTIIQYAIWRVMSGLHKSFQLSFLPSGHSSFAPDLYFGLFKSKFRECDVNSLMEVCQVAALSDSSAAVTAVIVANETGACYVNTYDWKTFFNERCPGPIPDLPSPIHFKTDSLNTGSVMCSTSPNDYSDPIIVFHLPFGTSHPNIIPPQPLSFERQKYLYTSIRSFVSLECQDLLCPIPKGLDSSVPDCVKEEILDDSTISNPTVKANNPVFIAVNVNQQILDTKDEQNTSNLVETNQQGCKRRIICSYCGEVGHINRMAEWGFVCPKRQLASEASAIEILDTKDEQNKLNLVETNQQGCKRRIICSYCGEVGHINRMAEWGFVCPKRQLASEASAIEMLDTKDEQNKLNLVETNQQGCKRRIICSYCGEVGHINRTAEWGFVCPKRQLASEASAIEMLDTKDEQNESNQQGCKRRIICSYCGEVGHINRMTERGFVCPKRQLASEASAIEMLDTKDEQNESNLVETNQQDCKRKIGACSYCGKVGHRNRIKGCGFVCPKRQFASEAAAIQCQDIRPCEECVTIDSNSDTDNSGYSNEPNLEDDKPVNPMNYLEIEQDEQSVAETSMQSGKRKKPSTCSYCGIVGHRNLVKHGIYFCKKRWLDLSLSIK